MLEDCGPAGACWAAAGPVASSTSMVTTARPDSIRHKTALNGEKAWGLSDMMILLVPAGA